MALQGFQMRLTVMGILVSGVILTSTVLHVLSIRSGLFELLRGSDAAIAVEHSEPLTLTLELVTKGSASLLTLTHDRAQAIPVSVPEDWKRGEVRGAALAELTGDKEPGLGFRRFYVPAGTTVTFQIRGRPRPIIVHNPLRAPLNITLVRIDLDTETVVRDIVLILEGPKRLW